MKRVTVIVALVVLVAGAGVAQDGTPAESERVTLDVGAHYTAGLFSSQWGANISAVYQLGFIGVGGGLKSFFGVGHDAVYLGPYARLELGWLYFGAGPLVLLQQPQAWASLDSPVSFLGTAGAGIPVVAVGPGRLGFDLGMDLSVTPFPVPETESTGSIIGDFFAALAAGTVGAVLNTFKLNAGVFYTVSF